ncbi:polysaccharide biosynthesis protein [Methanofollis aquaemaris]|uniref:Polysaccharide biosynthesis protein n=1 Tax=Methanofollis aquaemaris TaxID=126734 RepID=A0A8A3S6V3_9EURY|nr:UDP-N-acetylglucosamine 4,6-dehydratase family protein [Methanofollis aquaemaris]QSZ67868.1 polysaccharide biosynthesis protein [Methanofollis aquaemaris]
MDEVDFYCGKSILVTGGVGSIGKELVKKILKMDVGSVRVLDNNETGLFDLGQELQSDKIRLLVGDVRDKERLKRAMEGIDVVFHAAALKHVPLCEYNPFDAVKTNILGTQNVLNVALDEEVEKVIVISTDKAANPVNVMGATKLLAERLTLSANFYRGKRKTVFSCVRFGNVMASRGSVIPLFMEQIKGGGPVTVTDPEMTRFIMDIPKATGLILEAGKIAQHGEIFILKMPVLKIGDLADVMIAFCTQKYGQSVNDVRIKVTGARPGEKKYEELMTESEAEHAYENEHMFIVLPLHVKEKMQSSILPDGFYKSQKKRYSSSEEAIINKRGIFDLLRNLYPF